MWVSTIRSAIALPVVVFVMWLTVQVIGPILDIANAGPHADAESVQRVGGYFAMLTVDNLVLVGAFAVGIYAIGRAEDSGTDTAFRSNLYGDPEEPIDPDTRKGQNQQVATLVEQNDNAIAYIALAFVEPDGATPPIGLELDGTLYEYGTNLGAKEYPLSRDLHCYTYDGTDKRESAFINMILSEFGQTNFVEPNNYFKLPPERREEERGKLADQA